MTKLSEAMREGAKLRPQAREVYVSAEGATCALGAVCQVAWPERFTTLRDGNLDPWVVVQRFIPNPPRALCPACQDEEDPYLCEQALDDVIVELNDSHKWTREQIADWLAGLGY